MREIVQVKENHLDGPIPIRHIGGCYGYGMGQSPRINYNVAFDSGFLGRVVFYPFQILSDQVIFFPADVTWVLMHFSHLPFGFPLLSFSCPLCQKFLNSLLRTEGTSDASDAKSFKKLRLFCTRVFPGETGTLHKLTLEFLAKSSIISSSFQVARPLEAEERRATSCFSEVI